MTSRHLLKLSSSDLCYLPIKTCPQKKGGDIALIVLYGLAALIGFAGFGIYKDLIVWSIWCLVCAALAFVSSRKK